MNDSPFPTPTLHDVNLLHLTFVKDIASRGILDFARLGPGILANRQESLFAIDAAIGEYDRITLHIALGMMRIRHSPRQLIQLGRADGADRGRRGLRVGAGGCVGGVTQWGLERRETGREGNVEKWL